jgi:flagellar motility protein MotE (MotC chaperone)
MKNTIIYSIIFLIAFGAVTAGLIFINTQYNNIFYFDFTPMAEIQKRELEARKLAQQKAKVTADSIKSIKPNLEAIGDTTQITLSDTAKVENLLTEISNQKGKDSVSTKTAKTEVKATIVDKNLAKISEMAKKDSIYQDWLKQTVKLYENMDTKKVAKIIQGYSDNIARDLILKMKKKKAAEILAEFKPEYVVRIINQNQ